MVGTHASLARTIMLVFGALLSLTVAAYPLVASRRPGGTYSWRLSFFALLSAASFVFAMFLPTPKKSPVGFDDPPARIPYPLPAAGSLGPGTAIAVSYADGSGGMACTAGFLVHTSTGQAGMLTAGHCNKPGEASKVTMNSAAESYVTVGTFTQTVSEGTHGEAHDIGLIMLDANRIAQTPSIFASMPVSGVADDLQIGEQLCKFGMKTGRECGKITDVTESKVVFLAASQCGDSGGPVYLIRRDGAAAVGIHIRGGRPNDTSPNCSTAATFSVAELVRPWLDQWGLSVATG